MYCMALKRLRPISAPEEHSVCLAVVCLSSLICQTHVPSDYTVELSETHCFFDSPYCFFTRAFVIWGTQTAILVIWGTKKTLGHLGNTKGPLSFGELAHLGNRPPQPTTP